jgi:hypothetical protein
VTLGRLARILERPTGATPGAARWLVLEEEKPWPGTVTDPATVAPVHEVTTRLLDVGLGAGSGVG